jgi:hypothetical protein
MLHTKFLEKIETHFKYNIPPKNAGYALCEKGCRAQQDTDDNMVHAHGMLDN